MTDDESLVEMYRYDLEQLEEQIKELTRERDTALAEAERLQRQRDISWKEAAQLRQERDEARELASYLTVHAVDCFAYRAELLESYPWMRDVIKSHTWLARHKAEALEAE